MSTTTTTTTDRERSAFLRAIIEAPADDTPRLVYADWLDDHGEGARARLIRMQCLRDRFGSPRISVRKWFDPWWRGPSSYSFYSPQWDMIVYPKHGTDPDPDQSPGSLYVRRGFVDEVRLPLRFFTEPTARALFAAHPVTTVRLSDREPAERRASEVDRTPANSWSHDWIEASPEQSHFALAELPADIFGVLWELFPDGGRDSRPDVEAARQQGSGRWIEFPTRDLALSALSAACVAYGRSLAGLDPLPR